MATIPQIVAELDAVQSDLTQVVAELAVVQTSITQITADVLSLSPTPPTESPEGSTVTTTAGSIVDANRNVWTLVNSGGPNQLQIAQNGAVDTATSLVTGLLYHSHAVYQTSLNASSISWPGWWMWTGTAWVDVANPVPAPPTPAASVIQVNLQTPSPASAGVTYLSPYLFGSGTEGLGSPGVNTYYAAVNPGWQATYRAQNWRLFRVNCEATLADWTTPNSIVRQNFANGFKTFWTNETPSSPFVGNRLLFTVGSFSPDRPTPADCVNIANWLKSVGMECFWWEIENEPDNGMGGNGWSSDFTACRAALKQVNPHYQVGGPACTWPDSPRFTEAANAGADFASYHWYLSGTPGSLTGPSLYSQALSAGRSHVSNVQNSAFGVTTPIFIGEWSICWNGGDPADQTIDGAIFVNNYLYGALSQPNSTVEMGAIWTIGENASFTFVNNDGSAVRPRGLVLGALGRKMGGLRMQTAVGSGLPNVLAVASASGSDWAVWLTNYDSADHALNLKGLTGTTYARWECSPAHATVPLTSSNNAIAGLANITLPSRSVTIVSSR